MAPTSIPPSRPICCRSNANIGHAAGMDTTHEQFLKIQIDPAFYRSGEHSDIIVRYGSGSDTRERMLHKIVLCSQSEFFRLMLSAPMKESHESVVELHEDPDLIDSAIDFIYLGSLTLPELASPADVAVRILRTYEIANQYMIGALQDAAATRFSNLIKLNPSLSANVTVLRAAYEDLTRDTHNLQKLIARAYNIWAPAISHEMKSFLLENKDAIIDYFFEMARERLELGSCRVCWHCNYQVNVCVTPADPTVENRYDTPVYNAHFLKHCPSCGNPLQPKSLGPVLDD